MSTETYVTVLGKKCRDELEHQERVKTAMYITFRNSFFPTSKGYTSDTGFGC